MALNGKNLIEKQNTLNEIRQNGLTIQELRFFSIYLSKINARDVSTRKVSFSLSDFQKIMEFGRLNIAQLKATTNSLLSKVVNVPDENGGYYGFQLFKECHLYKDEAENWFIEIDAHDRALPLMFEFKKNYFTYELWNALRLKSSNQVRMYEILKQYEHSGERTLSLVALRELLGVALNEYPRWDRFKNRILDSCQKALAESTDIKYTYEPTKNGRGGKITGVKFFISKNANFVDQLTLDEFINLQEQVPIEATIEQPEPEAPFFANEQLEFLSEACNGEFNEPQMQVIFNAIIEAKGTVTQLEKYNYLKRLYDYMCWQGTQREIDNRFGYLKSIVGKDI